MFESARVIVLRGPIAIGKTSVAQELAGILGNVAVVPVDWLRHMVRGWRPESKSEARLAAINAAALARKFTTKGYDVIIEGPFDDPDALEELLSRLEGLNWHLGEHRPSLADRRCTQHCPRSNTGGGVAMTDGLRTKILDERVRIHRWGRPRVM